MSVRIALVAEEAAGAQALGSLLDASANPVVLLTSLPDEGSGSRLVQMAEGAGVPVLPADRVRDAAFAGELHVLGVDVLLNVHSLYLVHPEVLSAPSTGSFNLHPGPLPEYAGLNTPAWAIWQDAKEYGVTLHRMEERVDAGDIVLDDRFPLPTGATALSLGAECARRSGPLIREFLEALDRGSLPGTPQDLSRRQYFRGGTAPEGGAVDWRRPAADLERLSRAYDFGPFTSPWGRLGSLLRGRPVELGRIIRPGRATGACPGTLRPSPDGGLEVASGTEWVRVSTLWINGEKVPARAVLEQGTAFDSEKPDRP